MTVCLFGSPHRRKRPYLGCWLSVCCGSDVPRGQQVFCHKTAAVGARSSTVETNSNVDLSCVSAGAASEPAEHCVLAADKTVY